MDAEAPPATEPATALAARQGWWRRTAWWARDHAPTFFLLFLTSLLLLGFLWHRIVIVILAGEGGVRYRTFHGGVVIDKVAEEGLHLIPPWDTLTRYDARVQIIYHEFDVLTSQGLPVRLKIAARFHPVFELIAVLHKEVGPDYPNKIILPQIESVMRKGLGTSSPEDIYTNKDFLMTKLVAKAIEEISQRYIVVDDMLIRSVELPAEVRAAIEAKAVEQQRLLEYVFRLPRERQEAERKGIEAEGIGNYFKILSRTLDERSLAWRGIEATLKLAESNTTKVVVVGGTDRLALPLIMGDILGSGRAGTVVEPGGAAGVAPAAPPAAPADAEHAVPADLTRPGAVARLRPEPEPDSAPAPGAAGTPPDARPK